MRYLLGDPAALGNLYTALAFLPLGLFFDFFDGKVARWRKKSSLMGQELDSLADLVMILLTLLFLFLGFLLFTQLQPKLVRKDEGEKKSTS